MSAENEKYLPQGRASWNECTSAEKFEAAWQMSKDHYIAKGLYVEGQPFDRTAFRKMTREEWIKAEESEF
jgi:hypothetical protein